MACNEVMAAYIKKLSHPLKEIRERSLQLLVAKLKLGWQLEDELSGTRELLEALLAWFHVQQPTLQKEALLLLLSTIKTKSGTYISREIGIKKMITTLERIKHKIDNDAIESYIDVIETLRFLNSVESEENIAVPPLALHSLNGSERDSDDESVSGYCNLEEKSLSSKESAAIIEPAKIKRQDMATKSDGMKVLLFPWVELCSSDSKTLLLVEDAMKLLKSTRRCCRFICDVFLQDFPAEIFLNRPSIVKSLMTIAEGRQGNRPGDALHVLLHITRALRMRRKQLTSADLVHDTTKLSMDNQESADDIHHTELKHFVGDGSQILTGDDTLTALKQLSAPLYALETLHLVLSIMARNIALVDPVDKSEILDLKETNTCLDLIESLIGLLMDCVGEDFWRMEHNSKMFRDIAHKSCMTMRLLGDLLTKYRKSFYEDTSRNEQLVWWVRLLSCGERVLWWARHSALPPASLPAALQLAQLDPAAQLLYPPLSKRLASVLQNSRISLDQEYKNKYRELKKLFAGMDEAAKFMKNQNSCRDNKKVFQSIKKSLPILELHLTESYLIDVSDILLRKTKEFDMDDNDWSYARDIALKLMVHNLEWVQAKFYRALVEMVRGVLVGDEVTQGENEKCLNLLCDVGILTEICCHGMSSNSKEVETCASDIMLYLLRGRLVLSEACWWRLLASLLPVCPLLHVYAAHDTQLGQAICKSLEQDIAECMGVSFPEVVTGLVRLLFVRCPTVQYDAATSLCRILDDEKYLPPKESIRVDLLINTLRKIEPQDFNVDYNSSPTKNPLTIGLMQILDVLKQDIVLDEHSEEFVARSFVTPVLEPSLRRSTLQQLSVVLRQQELHDAFQACDGVRVVVAILRMSMTVDDYLAFPECAISCVSVLNSVCFTCRHSLAKIPDLPLLLLRVVLVFPADESTALMAAQILAMSAWSGFVLQELDRSGKRVPALPLSVTQRTSLPFVVNSYWNTSPNVEHSSVEWLLSDEDIRAAIRVQWWFSCEGGSRVILGAPPPPAPLALRPTVRDLAALRAACPAYSCTKALLSLENATSHRQVYDALCLLESYTHLFPLSSVNAKEIGALPWQHMKRFICAPPASSRDTSLLIALLRFILAYMDNVKNEGGAMAWIQYFFVSSDSSIIALLSKEELYLEQTPQESIEVTQLHIHIVKVLNRCVNALEDNGKFDFNKMESLVKILMSCLQRIDLNNFHMLGYLNELVRCMRYALNSRYCKLSEETLVECIRVLTAPLAGCAAGGGRKGQACRLDALLALLALLEQAHADLIPVQRWSEAWSGDTVRAVVKCSRGARPELRAAALHVMAALALYAQLMPHLLQAIPTESVSQYAASIFAESREANVVRSAAAALLTTLSSRVSPHTDLLEIDIVAQLTEHNFLDRCLEILVDFCSDKEYNFDQDPNLPRSILERRSELEVRAQKCGDVEISPSMSIIGRPPPTTSLLVSLADTLHNVSAFQTCPIAAWNERGLFRLLFRCASKAKGSSSDVRRVRLSTCRALSVAATHKCVRSTLAATKDCLLGLLASFTPIEEEEIDALEIYAKTQELHLIATLLSEKSASESIWTALKETPNAAFFTALLQCLECDETKLTDVAIDCMTQLALSTTHKKTSDGSIEQSRIKFLESLKCPFPSENRPTDRDGSGDTNRDCQPDYMIEELCKMLIYLYQKLAVDPNIYSEQNEGWNRVCSCLSAMLSVSHKSRLYGVHRHLPKILIVSLQTIRDKLSLHGSPDVLRSAAQNPILLNLNRLLILIDCHMTNCSPAKDAFAESGIAVSLNRLWPWCMLSPELRNAVTHLLFTFSNDSPKAWAAMSSCVGGRSLAAEVCTLVSREASLQSRSRSDHLLLLGLRALKHIVPNHHCRSIILKSEALVGVYKARVAERGVSPAGAAWARAVEALARHPDGAGVVLALRPLRAAPPVRALLMPALAHLARHRRAAVLQAADLLELISGTLLAGEIPEIVSATRAVWALAANNHRAKLLLRSAGIAAALNSALQRMQRMPDDPRVARALQLLLYTNSILRNA